MPTGEGARMAESSERIGNILRRVSKSLQPDILSQIERAEMEECLIALEQMKMLISEVEILTPFSASDSSCGFCWLPSSPLMWDGDAPSVLGGEPRTYMSQYIRTHFLSLGC